MAINVYVVTFETTCRDWGDTSFEVECVWPTFEKALEFLQQKKDGKDKSLDKFGESHTGGIDVRNDTARWGYRDWDGIYEFRIEKVEYYQE